MTSNRIEGGRGACLVVLSIALLGQACTLSPVDLGDRACPCAEGWHCDETGTCVPGAVVPPRSDGGAIADARPRDTAIELDGDSAGDAGGTTDGGQPVDAGGMDDGGATDGGAPVGYSRTLTVARARVTGTHADFPLLVALATDASLAAHARDDGSDLRFHASDGTLLPHEVESFDADTGALVAWVRVPEVSDARDAVLTLRYGHAEPPMALEPSLVWSSGFATVWHLNDPPAGAAREVYDSSGGGHTATAETAASSPTAAAGRIAGGLAFAAAAGQRLTAVSSADFDLASRSATVSVWVRADVLQSGGEYPRLLDRFRGGTPGAGWTFMFTPSRNVVLNHRDDGTGDDANASAAMMLNDATWHLLTVTLDGATSRFYLDGVLRESDPYSALIDTPDPLYIGAAGAAGVEALAGTLDEIRIAHVARSPGYVATEHRNQSDPGAFVTVGAEERF